MVPLNSTPGRAPKPYSKAFQWTVKYDNLCMCTFNSHCNSVIAYRLTWTHFMEKKTSSDRLNMFTSHNWPVAHFVPGLSGSMTCWRREKNVKRTGECRVGLGMCKSGLLEVAPGTAKEPDLWFLLLCYFQPTPISQIGQPIQVAQQHAF